jgi:hypothetical protein
MADFWNIEALIGHGNGDQDINPPAFKILDPLYSLLGFMAGCQACSITIFDESFMMPPRFGYVGSDDKQLRGGDFF